MGAATYYINYLLHICNKFENAINLPGSNRIMTKGTLRI